MSESIVMRQIQIALSSVGARVFRNNRAIAWAGVVHRPTMRETVSVGPNDVVLYNARPIHAGLVDGASDLIGWTGDGKGRFTAIEVKYAGGRTSREQDIFLDAVIQSGGVGFVARSADEAKQKYIESIQ